MRIDGTDRRSDRIASINNPGVRMPLFECRSWRDLQLI
jgi:hypothetical protein